MFVSPLGPDAWRYMYLIGMGRRCSRSGSVARFRVGGVEKGAARRRRNRPFTLFDLFGDRTAAADIIVFLMSLASTMVFWGISTWCRRLSAGGSRIGAERCPVGQLRRHGVHVRRRGGYISLAFSPTGTGASR